jgi:hypothetical protein
MGEGSQVSLNSFTPAGPSSSKLSAAQAELQACETHLAAKEKELDERRVSAVRRGLEARCRAMVECGWKWGEMGREGLRALEVIDGSSSVSNGTDGKSCGFTPFITQLQSHRAGAGIDGFFSFILPAYCCLDRENPVAPVRPHCAHSSTRVTHAF